MKGRAGFRMAVLAMLVGGCASSRTEEAVVEEIPPAPNIRDFESAFRCWTPQAGTVRGRLRARRWPANRLSYDEPLGHAVVRLELRDSPSALSSLTISDTTDATYGGFILRGVPTGQFADLFVVLPAGDERLFTGVPTDSLFNRCWLPRPGDDRDVINVPAVD